MKAIKAQINSYMKRIARSKWRYWAKVYSIYFGINKFLNIERLDANSVGEVLTKLESKVENERKTGSSHFYQVLNS